jgi:hydroxymethylpyrimidine pyrophosphatase-like HAD family hydrolase
MCEATTLFASDLDNTLIHSYKVAKPHDVCVEEKDGKALSFMSREAYALLRDVAAKCAFVPVTTRSPEQYRRIDLGVTPRHAIVAHGALLLADGEIDARWARETRRMLRVPLPKLRDDAYLFDVRYVEDAFIFAKSDDPTAAAAYLRTTLSTQAFDICAAYNKVYILPKNLNKGIAVTRLRERLSVDRVVCAGDSELDLSMLAIADVALAPPALAGRLPRLQTLRSDDVARELLECLSRMIG